MKHKVIDGVTYFDGNWNKKESGVGTLTLAIVGILFFVALIFWASTNNIQLI